jgi:pyruvate/2-oxoglutarate dehydrogenase complex dihydrolipoamide dehydrogenase (E3) component
MPKHLVFVGGGSAAVEIAANLGHLGKDTGRIGTRRIFLFSLSAARGGTCPL